MRQILGGAADERLSDIHELRILAHSSRQAYVAARYVRTERRVEVEQSLLTRFNGRRWIRIPTPNAHRIVDIQVDRQGAFWVITRDLDSVTLWKRAHSTWRKHLRAHDDHLSLSGLELSTPWVASSTQLWRMDRRGRWLPVALPKVGKAPLGKGQVRLGPFVKWVRVASPSDVWLKILVPQGNGFVERLYRTRRPQRILRCRKSR